MDSGLFPRTLIRSELIQPGSENDPVHCYLICTSSSIQTGLLSPCTQKKRKIEEAIVPLSV